MTEVAVLTVEHIMKFVPNEDLGVSLNDLRKRLIANLEDPNQISLAFVTRGEILAVTGMYYINKCSMEFWSIPSVLVNKMKREYAKAIKSTCYNMMGAVSAHRFIVAIEEDKPEWIKWAQFLEFEFECFARGYCPNGKSAWIFTKVIEKWQQQQ